MRNLVLIWYKSGNKLIWIAEYNEDGKEQQ